MNNLKKLLSVLVVVAMIATIAMPAFAAEGTYTYTAEAQKLNDLGLYKGVSTTTFDPDLGTALNRETGTVMLLRVFGLEAEAEAITDADATLAKFTDAASISSWAKNAVAYAVKNGIIQGYPDGTVGPKVALNGKAYCTMILRQLGFTPDYDKAPTELADKGGLTADEATQFASKELIKDDLVGISFGTLSASDKDGKKVIENLVAAKVVDETAATDAGLLTPAATPTPAPAASALDVSSACTLASKVVEVSLNTAAKAEDVAAATFKVADSAAKEVAVTKAELAAYDADSKTVVLTLEANTTAGTAYTLTCGTKSVKFGGKAPETTKPEVDKVTSTDYNEVKVTFTEPILLEGATFTLAEKYGTKASLAVTNVKYDGNDTLVLTTADQKGSTLYAITVEGALDFAGNKMDKSDDKTFVGTKKNDSDLEIAAAKANDYNHVLVEFNVKVDPATISSATLTLAEAYGSKTAVTVASVTKPERADIDDNYSWASNIDSSLSTDDKKDATIDRSVLLTLDGALKKSTLYKVTVSGGIKSAYGKALSTTDSKKEKTFVGVEKPTDELTYNGVSAGSNTDVTVNFARKVDKTLAETVANYAIAEAYGTKATVTITKAEIQDDNKSVKLTVSTMKNVLYKLTTTGVKDIYGNLIKTSSDANITTFVGKAVGEKIKTATVLDRSKYGSETEIWVKFDKNVGSNATDVSLYSIDNSIGYPQAAKVATSDDTKNDATYKDSYKAIVKLTIPKTVTGRAYKLTVKGLLNSDEVAMASDDSIDSTFVGKGSDAARAEIQSVYATDSYTFRIYFDRAADDATIKGKNRIWDGDPKDAGNVLGGALGISTNGDDTADYYLQANGYTANAFVDPNDANVLVVRVKQDGSTAKKGKFHSSNSTASGKSFKLVANPDLVKKDDSANIKEFGYCDDDVARPEIVDAYALNTRNIVVYLSEPVSVTTTAPAPAQFKIYKEEDKTTITQKGGAPVSVNGIVKISDTEYRLTTDVDLKTDASNLASGKCYLYLDTTTETVIKDKSTIFTVKPNDDKTYRSIEFGPNDTDPAKDKIDSVSVFMPDERTIQIYYPEQMNKDDVIATSNYDIFGTDSGSTASDIADLVSGQNPINNGASYATYDDGTFVATLYLRDDIGNLKYNSGHTFGKYYLAIKSTVKNAVGTNTIKDDKSGIKFTGTAPAGVAGLVVELANSSTDVAKIKVASATVSDDRQSIDIKMDTKVRFPDATNKAGTTFDTGAALTPVQIVAAYKITAQFESETSADKVVDNDILSASINDDHDTVTVKFKTKLAGSSSGTVGTKDATAGKVMNKQGTTADVTGDDASEVSFGVAPTLFVDIVKPVITAVSLTDAAGAGTSWDGIGDSLKVIFSENVALKVADATNVTAVELNNILGTSVVYGATSKVTATVSNNTIVFTVANLALSTGISAGTIIPGKATVLVTDTATTPNNLDVNTLPAVLGSKAYVTSVTSTQADGSYKAGTVIPIAVNFSQVVVVTGIPTLALNSGATVNYSSGSGSQSLIFNYTVGAADTATDLDVNNNAALVLAGGSTINDTAATPVAADLTLPTGAAANSLATAKAIIIDTTAPTFAATGAVLADVPTTANTPEKGDTITIVFSEDIDQTTILTGLTNDGTKADIGDITFTDGANNAISFAGITLGTIAVTAGDYCNNSDVVFGGTGVNANKIAYTAGTKTLVITLGAVKSGTVQADAAITNTTITGSASVKDKAGNALDVTPVTNNATEGNF